MEWEPHQILFVTLKDLAIELTQLKLHNKIACFLSSHSHVWL